MLAFALYNTDTGNIASKTLNKITQLTISYIMHMSKKLTLPFRNVK